MAIDTREDTKTNISSYFGVKSDKLNRHYKHKVCGFEDWDPKLPFYSKVFEQFYQTEMRLGKLLNLVTGIAILISCLGIFGLVEFSTQQ